MNAQFDCLKQSYVSRLLQLACGVHQEEFVLQACQHAFAMIESQFKQQACGFLIPAHRLYAPQAFIKIKKTLQCTFKGKKIKIQCGAPAWQSCLKPDALSGGRLGHVLLGQQRWDLLAQVRVTVGPVTIGELKEIGHYQQQLYNLKKSLGCFLMIKIKIMLVYKTSHKLCAIDAALNKVRLGSSSRLGVFGGILKGATSIISAPLILKD